MVNLCRGRYLVVVISCSFKVVQQLSNSEFPIELVLNNAGRYLQAITEVVRTTFASIASLLGIGRARLRTIHSLSYEGQSMHGNNIACLMNVMSLLIHNAMPLFFVFHTGSLVTE